MSGIYIPGMEVPKTCCYCPLMGYDPDREWFDSMARTGAHICVLTGELIDNTKREDHCPLVPVPEHGDLIDRDEYVVMLRLKRARCGVGYTSNAITMCVKDANDMPTIIPADNY